ncbi:MAG: META domain-containing protein [Paraprevotella sp.]|nr:META domain-containing protein [Paraprevotella sp.]
MKTLRMMGGALLALLLASSCKSSKNALETRALNGEWTIMTVNGKKAIAGKDIYLGLDIQQNRLYGCAGCNRIMGSLQTDQDKAGSLTFGQVVSTRMLCPDMDTEQAVLNALEKVTGYKGTEKELSLTDKGGQTLITLSKRPAASLTSLNGKWNITKVYDEAVGDIEKTEKGPFLEFNAKEKTVHGNAGCNIVNGNLVQEEGQASSLKFDQLLTTMMAGPGMTLEGKVLEAMNKVKGFVVKDEHTAVLTDENGAEALTLEK